MYLLFIFYFFLYLARVKKIKEQVFVDSIHLKHYENKLVYILYFMLFYFFTLLKIAFYFRLYMIRYNEDPCLNLNGPERKFLWFMFLVIIYMLW